jgi:RES domain-containing protein
VTAADRIWPDVLSGAGSYFSAGGRYNRIHQRTVYAAEDPVVSVCEYAFHHAVALQRLLGCGPLNGVPIVSPPVRLVTEHTL